MKRFAENNLQELQGWNDGQKLNGDYAIEGWVHYLENILEDINKELGRRMELVGNPKTTFEELKDLFNNSPPRFPTKTCTFSSTCLKIRLWFSEIRSQTAFRKAA